MRLPNLEDVLQTLPEEHEITPRQVEAELELAQDVLELMTAMPVLKKTIQERLFLRDWPELLRHFPARDVRADGHPIPYVGATGVVYPELEPSNYLVTYTVGYDRNDVPAIFARAVLHLVRHRLLRTEEDQEEATAAIAIMRLGIQKLRKDRERDQADRKSVG